MRRPTTAPFSRRGSGALGIVTLLLCPVLLLSCDADTGLGVELELFDPLSSVEELDFASVHPAEEWLYWELRFSWGTMPGAAPDVIMGAGGTVSREALPAGIREELDALRLPSGFAGGCLPSWCFKFIAAVDPDGHVVTFASTPALIEFLGPRDSLAEAVLLLDASSYSWHSQDTGIRPRGDGWEAVVLELVRDCAPVQTDRLLVRVGRTSDPVVLRREVWERLENACV